MESSQIEIEIPLQVSDSRQGPWAFNKFDVKSMSHVLDALQRAVLEATSTRRHGESSSSVGVGEAGFGCSTNHSTSPTTGQVLSGLYHAADDECFVSKGSSCIMNEAQSDAIRIGTVRLRLARDSVTKFPFHSVRAPSHIIISNSLPESTPALLSPADNPSDAADTSHLVPFAEQDLLALLLYEVHHARRRRVARYLRLWGGEEYAGRGALGLWLTERVNSKVCVAPG